MSLVIEALRRVEKSGARAGAIGAAVASYSPAPRPRNSSTVPLLLGILTGGGLVLALGGPGGSPASVPDIEASALAMQARPLKGAAGLPPPMIIESALRSAEVRPAPTPSADTSAAANFDRRGEVLSRPAIPPPPLILQAISERDSRPIAIINDQLVREGEKLGAVRIVKIGADSVEVLLENGKHDTVRFAPPPPLTPQPSPSPLP